MRFFGGAAAVFRRSVGALVSGALAAGPLAGPVATAVWPTAAEAAHCAAPGKDGSPAAAVSGVVNTFYPGEASVTAGATSITLGAATGATGTPIAAGDMLLVIQMQDATLNSTNTVDYGDGAGGQTAAGVTGLGQSGVYEFVRAASAVPAAGGTLTLVGGGGGGLLNAYNNAANASTRGPRRFQVIRVPQYVNVSVGAVTTVPWNGRTGGVVAVDAAGTLNLAGGSITASGMGFRGGGGKAFGGTNVSGGTAAATDYVNRLTNLVHGAKGEGVAGYPYQMNENGAFLEPGDGYPSGSAGRGAPGNAGGGGTDGNPSINGDNAGGGGGAGDRAAGGRGGRPRECTTGDCLDGGGYGGAAMNSSNRMLMGGGGGAGTSNDGSGGGTPAGFASSGAPGGGLVFVRASTITGTGAIYADGAAASDAPTGDGGGGGGGGGEVMVWAGTNSGAALSIFARGGKGGSTVNTSGRRGPGGGGGGGAAQTSFSASFNLSGGASGVTTGNDAWGATAGATGSSQTALTGVTLNGVSSGAECTPSLTMSYHPASIPRNGISRFRLTLSNPNPNQPMTAGVTTDTYTTGVVNTAAPNASTTCSPATVAAAASGNSLGVTGATIPASGSCVVEADLTASTPGAYVDSPPSAGLTATIGGSSLKSVSIASATLTVTDGLTAATSQQVVSDPVNGAVNPKAIPGAEVAGSITITNPAGGGTVDAGTVFVRQPMPSNASLRVSDVGAAGSGPVVFADGSPASGLTYTFTSLASTTDSLAFSNDGGATWTYVPTANAGGVDSAVTHVEIKPGGAMAPGRSATLTYRFVLK